jgi:hypothetical protein
MTTRWCLRLQAPLNAFWVSRRCPGRLLVRQCGTVLRALAAAAQHRISVMVCDVRLDDCIHTRMTCVEPSNKSTNASLIYDLTPFEGAGTIHERIT